MINRSAHGGRCCGIHHLYNFTNEATEQLIYDVLSEIENDRMAEVVLSSHQIGYQSVMSALARMNFVLTDAWHNGNSGNNCYRFSRAARRLSITNVRNWTGATAANNPHGTLQSHTARLDRITGESYPQTPVQTVVEQEGPDNREVGGFRVGDQVQVSNRGLVTYGATGTVVSFEGSLVRINFPALGAERNYRTDSLTLRQRGTARPAVATAARTVFSTYHNVFANGNRGAGYDTYAAAYEARGRRTRIDRRNIMSDGTVAWVQSVRS